MPAQSLTHGNARWATKDEMRDTWRGRHGVVVGEEHDPRLDPGAFESRDRRTWGRGGTSDFLIDDLKGATPHSLVIAGTGAGKTMSLIPTLGVTWTGPCVVFDPAVEIEPMVRWSRRQMGRTVWTLDLTGASKVGFNVLEGIDINSPVAETQVLARVEEVMGYTAKSDHTAEFFKDSGKSFFACLVLDTMWNPNCDPALKNLRTIRALQSQSLTKKKRLLKNISENSASMKARQLAAELIGSAEADETLIGIFLNAHHCTEWLTTEAYADLVSGDAFHAADITRGDTDVFICLPSESLEGTSAGVARCILGALMHACYDADGANHPTVLFTVDEARKLRRMSTFENARDDSRKYRVALHMLYQARSQLDDQWGIDGARSWLNAAAWTSYSAVGDVKTAEEISKSIGTRGLQARSRSRSRSFSARGSRGRTTTVSEIAGALIQPSQVMQLRTDARLILVRGRPPVICGAPLWYRRKEPVYQNIGANRFYAPPSSPPSRSVNTPTTASP